MSRNHLLSQNFLRSPKLAMLLVGHTDIKKRDFTLDIGAGSGVFTYALSKKSAEVLAVEIDEKNIKKLKYNFRGEENIKILKQDILKLDLEKLPKNYKVCSNIPFNLSSEIISNFLNARNMPNSMSFILQKQFAKKIISSSTNFTSALGIKLFPFYEVKIKKPLRRTDFTPPPAVDTVFLTAKIRPKPFLEKSQQAAFNKFVDENFHSSEKFKKLKTKFPELAEKKPSEIDGEIWAKIFKNLL